jgi:hypothetical protein
MNGIPEHDWKYLRSIQTEMLDELSSRINDEVRTMLARGDLSENEKRLSVYDIVTKKDKIVAMCFDDWRRSTIVERCWALHKHGLLKPQHLEKLDPMTQNWIRPIR